MIAVYEPALAMDATRNTAWLERFDRELADGKLAAAMITSMYGLELAPPFFKVMPRRLLASLTEMAMKSEDSKAAPEAITMRKLAPTIHYEGVLIAEMAGTVDAFRTVTADVLILGGSKGLPFLKPAREALARTLPRSRRWSSPAWTTAPPATPAPPIRGGKPEMCAQVAREVRTFFATPTPVRRAVKIRSTAVRAAAAAAALAATLSRFRSHGLCSSGRPVVRYLGVGDAVRPSRATTPPTRRCRLVGRLLEPDGRQVIRVSGGGTRNTVVTFGDSITNGHNSTVGGNDRYPDALAVPARRSRPSRSRTVIFGAGRERRAGTGQGVRVPVVAADRGVVTIRDGVTEGHDRVPGAAAADPDDLPDRLVREAVRPVRHLRVGGVVTRDGRLHRRRPGSGPRGGRMSRGRGVRMRDKGSGQRRRGGHGANCDAADFHCVS